MIMNVGPDLTDPVLMPPSGAFGGSRRAAKAIEKGFAVQTMGWSSVSVTRRGEEKSIMMLEHTFPLSIDHSFQPQPPVSELLKKLHLFFRVYTLNAMETSA